MRQPDALGGYFDAPVRLWLRIALVGATLIAAMPGPSQALDDVEALLAEVDGALALVPDYAYDRPRNFFTPVVEAVRLAATGAATNLRPALNQRLAAALEGPGTVAGKDLIVRQLVLIADEHAVAALASLLEDEETFGIALGALAQVPGTAADGVLIRRLEHAFPQQLLALIQTLGDRQSAAAAAAIAPYLHHGDIGIARASVRALSSVGTEEAYRYIDALPPELGGRIRADLEGALLLRAERMIAAGNREEGFALCDRLLAEGGAYVQGAALNMKLGAMDPCAMVDAAMTMLADEEAKEASQAIALTNLMALPEDTVDHALLERLNQWPENQQLDVLEHLAFLFPRKVIPHALVLRESEAPTVVARAADLIAFFDPWKTIERIAVQAAEATDGAVREKARHALDTLAAEDMALLGVDERAVNSALLTLAREVAPAAGKEILASVQRRIGYLDDDIRQGFCRLARDLSVSAPLRVAVYEALGALSDRQSLPDMVDWLADDGLSSGRPELEQAIAAICGGMTLAPEEEARILEAAARAESPAALESLFRLMSHVGGPDSLACLRAQALCVDEPRPPATEDHQACSPDIAMAAARAFARTSQPDALPYLAEVVERSKTLSVQVLALRGLVRLASAGKMPIWQRIQWCHRAYAAAPRPEEKRLVLSKLSEFVTAEALMNLSLDDKTRQALRCLAEDSSAPTPLRITIYKALLALHDWDILPAMFACLADSQHTSGHTEIEQSILAMYEAWGLEPEHEASLLDVAARTRDIVGREALFRLASLLGGPDSFAYLKSQILEADAASASSAASAFAATPKPAAIPYLAEVAEQATTPAIQAVALRGLVRLVSATAMSIEERIHWYERAFRAAPGIEENQLVLGKICELHEPQALALFSLVLDKPSLRPMAEGGVREIVFSKAITQATSAEGEAVRAIDGDPATVWNCAPSPSPSWLGIDFSFHYKLHYCVFLGDFPAESSNWHFIVLRPAGWDHNTQAVVRPIDGGLLFELNAPEGLAGLGIEYQGEAPIAWSVAEVQFLYPGADKLGVSFPPFP